DIRCAFADHRCEQLWVGRALAPPNSLTVLPDRYCRLFHGYVETDIVFHGCPPFGGWARCRSRARSSSYRRTASRPDVRTSPPHLRWLPLPRLRHVRSTAQTRRLPMLTFHSTSCAQQASVFPKGSTRCPQTG